MARIPLGQQQAKWRAARAGFHQEKLDECTTQGLEAVDRGVEAALAGGPWLLGDFYSLADINFFAYCGGALEAMFPEIAHRGRCPRVMDWIGRVKARPAVTRALATAAP